MLNTMNNLQTDSLRLYVPQNNEVQTTSCVQQSPHGAAENSSENCAYCNKEFGLQRKAMPEKAIKRIKKRQGVLLKIPVCQSCFCVITTIPTEAISPETKIRRSYSLSVKSDLKLAQTAVYQEDWENKETRIREVLGRASVEIAHIEKLIKERLDELEALTSIRNELFNRHFETKDALLRREEKLYSARRAAADLVISNPSVRDRIFTKFQWMCRICKSTDRLSIDHIIPVLHGGSSDDWNLQCLCGRCNSKKGAKIDRSLGVICNP